MTRDICNNLCVFTLYISLYVSAHISLFRRYVTILTPVPLHPAVTSFSHLCLNGQCLHNSDLIDLNTYATILRRDPRVAQDNTIKSTERIEPTTNWRQKEFITHEINKSVRAAPHSINASPTKSIADYVETHASIAPNKTTEKNERIHIHLEFCKTLDKFERIFYMVSLKKIPSKV